jgi:hypothetical protein
MTERVTRWYLACSAGVQALLIGLVVVLLISNLHTTDGQEQSNITQCQLANITRHQDIAIWDQFLKDLTPPKPRVTPKVTGELAVIYHLIVLKDTPRNCQKAFEG